MITIRRDALTLQVPHIRIDVDGAVREIVSYVKEYFNFAGPILVEKIKQAAQGATDHLPDEWATNFNGRLRHTINRVGQYALDLMIESDYTPGKNNRYLQYLVMEVGTSGIHRGPRGRMVWGDRLARPQHASRATSTKAIPQFDHDAGDGFFHDTVKKYEDEFFSGLEARLNFLFQNGFFLKHLVVE